MSKGKTKTAETKDRSELGLAREKITRLQATIDRLSTEVRKLELRSERKNAVLQDLIDELQEHSVPY